jgi:hypothetical protein
MTQQFYSQVLPQKYQNVFPELAMAVYICNPSTWEAEAGES